MKKKSTAFKSNNQLLLIYPLTIFQKLGMILVMICFKKMKLSKNNINKKCVQKLVLLIEKKNQKDLNDSWHKNFTLKVIFQHFFTTSQCNAMNKFIKYSVFIWLQLIFGQKPCFLGPSQLARQKVNIHSTICTLQYDYKLRLSP